MPTTDLVTRLRSIDNDGDADVFLARGNFKFSTGMSNTLLRNDNGTFHHLTWNDMRLTGFNGSANGITAEFLDFDLDGLQDLFVGRESFDCELWHNQGNGSFVDVAPMMNVTDCGFAKGVAVGVCPLVV